MFSVVITWVAETSGFMQHEIGLVAKPVFTSVGFSVNTGLAIRGKIIRVRVFQPTGTAFISQVSLYAMFEFVSIRM